MSYRYNRKTVFTETAQIHWAILPNLLLKYVSNCLLIESKMGKFALSGQWRSSCSGFGSVCWALHPGVAMGQYRRKAKAACLLFIIEV